MSHHNRHVFDYRALTYHRATDDASRLSAFVDEVELASKSGHALDVRVARALRFKGFLMMRAEIKTATLEWKRATPAAQRRYMLYLVNRGALEASAVAGARLVGGPAVGMVLPGDGGITLQTLTDSDITIFSFDAQAVSPHTLDPRADHSFPSDSPVLRAASAFLASVLSSTDASTRKSAHVLRRMTADVAIALLSEARSSRTDRSTSTVMKIIDSNFSNPDFSVQSLCEEMRASRRTVERICADAGFSPSEALRLKRTEHARELLLAVDRSRDTEPWRYSGFSSTEQMRRAFRHFYGCTPRQLLSESRRRSGSN